MVTLLMLVLFLIIRSSVVSFLLTVPNYLLFHVHSEDASKQVGGQCVMFKLYSLKVRPYTCKSVSYDSFIIL